MSEREESHNSVRLLYKDVAGTTMNTCPVCGYPDLPNAPLDMSYEICPSCGTEFGYNDFAHTAEDRSKRHKELMLAWVRGGLLWHADWIPQPDNWRPRVARSIA